MGGNPKGSKWRNTPSHLRKRKRVVIYLDASTIEALVRLALPGELTSRTIERILRKEATLAPLEDAAPIRGTLGEAT